MILGDRPQTPEAALVTAIIMQAYRDLFMTVRTGATASFTARADQDQAMSFLTDRTGTLARHRNHLCSLIGWDGDVLAERIRAMMEGDDFPMPTDRTPAAHKRGAQAVENIRARWRYLKNPPKQPAPPNSAGRRSEAAPLNSNVNATVCDVPV